VRLVVGVGGVQDPPHSAVVHPDSGGDAVQRVPVVVGGEDRLDGLDGDDVTVLQISVGG
jgi:hypothetical protein